MIEMLDDNETSLILTKNLKSQNWTKHIDVIYHNVQKLVEDGELVMNWIASLLMLAYDITKVLYIILFKKYQDQWELKALGKKAWEKKI